MKLVVLYEELAGYMTTCLAQFSRQCNAEVHVVRKQVNKEAPFQFRFDGFNVYDRENYSEKELLQLVRSLQPDAILCGGWATKSYLKIVSSFQKKIPCIVAFDNNWTGSFKQRLATALSPFFLRSRFNGCFVPGQGQREFALRLGFPESRIALGVYSCDYDLFHSVAEEFNNIKQQKFPHKFLYLGRYVEHKGIHDLWNAFEKLKKETLNDWELWCIGTGEVPPRISPGIKHFGFQQPEKLRQFLGETGIFILPSHFEPWGVVVHELAAAGFPMICSDRVGASSAFVENKINGYIYSGGNAQELAETMRTMMLKTDEELIQMGVQSRRLAKQLTPAIWASRLMHLIQQINKE